MKRTLIYLCMVAAMSAFTSCEKDIAEADSLLQPGIAGRYSLNAAISVNSDETATRTQLAEGEDEKLFAMWTEGDAIAVTAGRADDGGGSPIDADDGKDGKLTKYQLAKGSGSQGVFVGDVAPVPMTVYGGTNDNGSGFANDVVTDYYAAIYPYETAFYHSDYNTGTASASVGAIIPASQKFVEGSFDEEAMPLVGFWKDGDETIYFKPVGAVIHLQLYADAPTTLEKLSISSAPEVAGMSYNTTQQGLAGEVALSAPKGGIYAQYNDPSFDYITVSNWGVNEVLITPPYDGEKTIEVTGPIELSTDASNPTDVYVVVAPCRLPADIGFTVTMDTDSGERMEITATDPIINKPTISYVEQPCLLPGDILDMPALKFEGATIANTSITKLEATCNWPYLSLTQEEDADLGSGMAPVWSLDYNSFESEDITLHVTLNNPLDGARIQGTESLQGTNINIYEWTELKLTNDGISAEGTTQGLESTMRVQSRSVDQSGAYLLYMEPSLMYDSQIEGSGAGAGTTDPNWDGKQDRNGVFIIETFEGEVLGYIKFHQASTASTATYAFRSAVLNEGADKAKLTLTPAVQDQTFENSMTLQMLNPNSVEEQYCITIQTAENNQNQADGLYIDGAKEANLDNYISIPDADWISVATSKSLYEGGDGYVDIYIKFAPAENNDRSFDLRVMDAAGNFCSLLTVSQPGLASDLYNCVTVQGIYPIGPNVWEPVGEWMGCIDVIPDGAPEGAAPNDFDLYEGYTLRLPTAEAVTVELTAAGVYNGNEENLKLSTNTKYPLDENEDGEQDKDAEGNPLWLYPKESMYASIYTYGGADWISNHIFQQGMIQDAMANNLKFDVAENTTGQERTTTIQFRMRVTGFVVGTLTVVQPAN